MDVPVGGGGNAGGCLVAAFRTLRYRENFMGAACWPADIMSGVSMVMAGKESHCDYRQRTKGKEPKVVEVVVDRSVGERERHPFCAADL